MGGRYDRDMSDRKGGGDGDGRGNNGNNGGVWMVGRGGKVIFFRRAPIVCVLLHTHTHTLRVAIVVVVGVWGAIISSAGA